MKKAQVMGMPLVLLFGLILGAIILIWGVYMIFNLMDSAELTELADKVTDLRNKMDVFSNYDTGATQKYTVAFPSKIEYVCFYNPDEVMDCKLNGGSCPSDLIEFMEITADSNNVYIYPPEYEQIKFEVEDLYPKEANPECIRNQQTAIIEKTEEYVTISYYGA